MQRRSMVNGSRPNLKPDTAALGACLLSKQHDQHAEDPESGDQAGDDHRE